MSGRWFRTYEELVDDPKVQMLSDRNFRALVNIWCLASRNDGALPPIDQVAFSLRMKPKQLSEIIGQLTAAELLEHSEGLVRPHNWDGRQFKSDVTDPTNATRQKRYRDRHGVTPPVTGTVTVEPVTPKRPDTDTDTETETEKTPSLRSGVARSPRPQPGARIPENFSPDIAVAVGLGLSPAAARSEAANFIDYWRQSNSRTAVKRDWPAAWRVWCRKAISQGGPHGQNAGNRRPDGRAQSSKSGLLGRLAEIASEGSGQRERSPDPDGRIQDQPGAGEAGAAQSLDLGPASYRRTG